MRYDICASSCIPAPARDLLCIIIPYPAVYAVSVSHRNRVLSPPARRLLHFKNGNIGQNTKHQKYRRVHTPMSMSISCREGGGGGLQIISGVARGAVAVARARAS